MLSSASSSGSGLASARFIAVSRRCSDGEKIDGRDMEVGGRGRCGAHGLPTEVTIQTCWRCSWLRNYGGADTFGPRFRRAVPFPKRRFAGVTYP